MNAYATQKETAVLEVRPLIGSYVSVAQFRVLKDVQLVNCSQDKIGIGVRWLKDNLTPQEIEKSVWSDINRAFSEPVERGDEGLAYVPTQILAEVFKAHGFGGIAYKSSYGEQGSNVVLFDVDVAELRNCQLYHIKDVTVRMDGADNPYFVK